VENLIKDPDDSEATLLARLQQVRENLQAVAETRSQITLRHKGVEVQCDTGQIAGDEV